MGVINGGLLTIGSDGYIEKFIVAAGGRHVFTNTELTAVTQLKNDLIASGFWNRFECLYPVIGDNSKAWGVNLVSPGEHPIIWASAPTTMTVSGLLFNGSNHHGYTDVYYGMPLTDYTFTDTSFSFMSYVTNTANIQQSSMGFSNANISRAIQITPRRNNATDSGANIGHISNGATLSNNRNGLFMITRTTTTDGRFIRKTESAFSTTTQANTYASWNTSGTRYRIGIFGSFFNESSASPFNGCICFAAISSGFTDAEARAVTQIIQDYQTALGRAV